MMDREKWIEMPLGEVVISKKGKKPKFVISEQKRGYVPYILIDELEGKEVRAYTDEINLPSVNENDVLLVWDGSIGKCGSGLNGVIGSTLVGLTPLGGIPTKFLEYTVLQANRYIKETSTGIGLQHINKNFFEEYITPLPPLNEQKRIVEKLDIILPKVKSAKKRLEKTPGILKKFRQSVLAAACSGRLTEDWREGKDTSTNIVFFENIERQRALNYSLCVRKAKVEGKRKPKKPANLNDKLYLEGIENFEELPANWLYIPLAKATGNEIDSLVDGPFGSSINVETDYLESGVTVVRINNIRPFRFVVDNFKFVSNEKYNELKRHNIKSNDVLLVKVGATIGDCCIYSLDHDSLLSTTGSCRIRVDNEITSPTFICIVLNRYKKYLQDISSEMAQPFLNMDRIKNLPIPLPSVLEQNEIVRRVEKLFALADSLEVKYKKATEQVNKIEQSVLAKAFRGALVEADPNDEPAEELLKRILAEKAKLGSKVLKRKKKRS